MEYVKAKSLISHQGKNIGFNGAEYNMNLYRGCNHGCIYCDSRSSCYQIEEFDKVCAKENALSILDKELSSKRKKGIIGFGAMSDPYNSFEESEELTKGALKLCAKYQFGVSLLTKSDLVLRDVELFKKINLEAPAAVRMTITTFDDELAGIIEPNISVSSNRFNALQIYAQNDIVTGIHLWPILAFINDDIENIKNIVEKAAECGIDYVYPYFGVTLRHNQRAYFFQKLDRYFPGVKKEYIKTFGESYECLSPNRDKLWTVFEKECKKHHLLYKTPDIVSKIRNSKKQKQIMMF